MQNKKLFKVCGLTTEVENQCTLEDPDTKTIKLGMKKRFVDISKEYRKKYIDKLHYNCQNMERNLSKCRKRIDCFTPVRKTHKALTTESTESKLEELIKCAQELRNKMEIPVVIDELLEDSIHDCENK